MTQRALFSLLERPGVSVISPLVALVNHTHFADKDMQAWGRDVKAEWKAPELCEHRMPRRLVVSQSPAVGVCASLWCQGLVEKRLEITPVEECTGTKLFRMSQDGLSNSVCSVTQELRPHRPLRC